MMRPAESSASPPPSRPTQLAFRLQYISNTIFTFQASPQPVIALTFPPRPSPPRPRKRCRAVTDIDGEHSCLYKKKRRLRLFLITSRLSPEYSSPATNIVNRGSSKIAVWAKQKTVGRNLLRKAAIFNRIRRRAMTARGAEEGLGSSLVAQEREQKQLELARLAFVYGSHDSPTRPVLQTNPTFPPSPPVRVRDHFEISGSPNSTFSSPNGSSPSSSSSEGEAEEPTYRSPNDAYSYSLPPAQIPRRSHVPLPPSPLGLSNYDAFDLEDDIPDPYSHLDEDVEDQAVEKEEDTWPVGPGSPSARTPASLASTLSTAPTVISEALNTPAAQFYSDFNILDQGEPVIEEHDQVDGGADAMWSSALVAAPALGAGAGAGTGIASQEQAPSQPMSCSPNFPALFATSNPVSASQEQSGSMMLADVLDRKEAEIKKERERQRNLLSLHFRP